MATGGRVFTKFSRIRGVRSVVGRCIITETDADETTVEPFLDPNPTEGFPCTVILTLPGGVGKVELHPGPSCPDVITKKRISEKGNIKLECSGPVDPCP